MSSEEIIRLQQQTIEAYKSVDDAKSQLVQATQQHVILLEKLANVNEELVNLKNESKNEMSKACNHQKEMDLLRSETQKVIDDMKKDYEQKLEYTLKRNRMDFAAEVEKDIYEKVKVILCDDTRDREIERRVRVKKSELCVIAREFNIPCSNVPSMRANIGMCMKLEAICRTRANGIVESNGELIEELD